LPTPTIATLTQERCCELIPDTRQTSQIARGLGCGVNGAVGAALPANADGLPTDPLEAGVVVLVPVLVRGTRVQLSHYPRPLSLIATPCRVFSNFQFTCVARRVFSAPRSGRRLASGRPELRWAASGSGSETALIKMSLATKRRKCPKLYLRHPGRSACCLYILFRGFLALRNFPHVDHELITIRRVDGHSQTHGLLVTVKGSPLYFIHRDPAVWW
jgi:hypothetical protein